METDHFEYLTASDHGLVAAVCCDCCAFVAYGATAEQLQETLREHSCTRPCQPNEEEVA